MSVSPKVLDKLFSQKLTVVGKPVPIEGFGMDYIRSRLCEVSSAPWIPPLETTKMDPDKTLEEIRALVLKMQEDFNSTAEGSNGIDQDEAYYLTELIDGLDEWIKKGGFLPKAWRR